MMKKSLIVQILLLSLPASSIVLVVGDDPAPEDGTPTPSLKDMVMEAPKGTASSWSEDNDFIKSKMNKNKPRWQK